MWRHLRNRGVAECKFRRQHPVEGYVVDFVCLEAQLIIEVDGGQHAEAIADADARRTRTLEVEGYRVLRFWNDEVLTRTDDVLATIHAALTSLSR